MSDYYDVCDKHKDVLITERNGKVVGTVKGKYCDFGMCLKIAKFIVKIEGKDGRRN